MKLNHLLSALLVQFFASLPILANPIVPANDGVNSIVNQNGQTFNITGGTQAGANLFHSLQKFGLDANQIANFMSRPDIANILTRVVGGEASFINGLIQVTGGNSNLYILNPAGIIFGANASLNVPAAFTATTANAIQVGNGYFSINSTVEQIRQLNGTVNGFAFSNLNTSFDGNASTGIIINQGNLTGSAGNSIVLLGGIVINTGTISTPHGKIIISALPDGKFVRVTTEGGLVSYDLPIADNQDLSVAGLRPIQATDFPVLLTGRSAGTTEVSGTLSTASSTVNQDALIFISGETVRLHNAILDNEGTNGTIRLQISTSTPISGFTFLDRVRNYEQIANTLTAGNQLILLSRNDSGIAKVSQVLDGKTDIKNLQFVSDGNAGQIWLGRDFITNDTLASYETQISNWKQALAPSADILFFTCNLAQTADGQLLLTKIENLTNANIAASTDITGNMAYGGNWNLEYGIVSTAPSFNLDKLQFADVKLATFTVLNTNNSGAGSLRAQIGLANGSAGLDDIKFAPATNGIPIVLTSGELVVTDPAGLTITGNGASNTIIDGNNASRVFNVTNGNISFDGVTIRNGNANNGGGIRASGTVTLTNSTVSGNTATVSGGGIRAIGTVTLTNSTVSGNTAGQFGGGIWAGSTVTLTNSTVSGNTAGVNGGGIRASNGATIRNSTIALNNANNGGGIFVFSGTIDIGNSIVAQNTAGTSPDIGSNSVGTGYTNAGNNLIGINTGFETTFPTGALIGTASTPVDPLLAPLANNGGPTQTHALKTGSPALNAGSNAITTVTTDQRGAGFARVVGGTVDIGAYEVGYSLSVNGGSPQSATVDTNFGTPLSAKLIDSATSFAVQGVEVTFNTPLAGASGLFGSLTTTTAITDSNGIATASTLKANTTAGTYTASGSIPSITPVSFTLTNTPDVLAALTITGGNNQSTVVNTAFANQLQVSAADQFGNLLSNQNLTFDAPVSGASAITSLSPITTDLTGSVSVPVTANTKAGSYTASLISGAIQADFTLTNTPDVLAALTITGGNNQSTVVNTAFANQLQVSAADQFGNLLSNQNLIFDAPVSGASAITSLSPITTDLTGSVSVPVTANTKAGSYTASLISGAIQADFTLTNTPDVLAALTITGGNNQSTVVNTAFANQLQVSAADQFGNLLSNQNLTFDAPVSGASAITSLSPITTDLTGSVSVPVTANTKAGSYTASLISGAIQADFTLTNTPDVLAALTITGGNNQSTVVNTAFANQLQVSAADQFGNLLSNQNLTFSAPVSGASAITSLSPITTDLTGSVSVPVTANTKAGSYTASLISGAIQADFTLTNTPDVLAALTITGGNNQSTVVNTAFANPLQVTAKDQFGNLLSNQNLTFSAPVSGASAITSLSPITTDLTGSVSVPVSANTKAGSYTASLISGAIQADFTLTNTPDVLAALTITGGNNQSTVVNTAFANPLQVTAKDQFGNLLSNQNLTFDAPVSGASAITSLSPITTDLTGSVSVPVSANTKAGSYTASLISGAIQADFTLTNTPDVLAALTITGGNNQSTVVNTAFANQLQVSAADQFGNLIPNQALTFSAPVSGASAITSLSPIITNSTGSVSVPVTANSTAGNNYTVRLNSGLIFANFTLSNIVPNIQPETQIRSIPPNLFCSDWDEFVPVNFQGAVIKVPIEKCNPAF